MDEIERERWRGGVDAVLTQHSRDIIAVELAAKKADERAQALELAVAKIATKIAIFASFGAFVGGVAMQLVVKLFFSHAP